MKPCRKCGADSDPKLAEQQGYICRACYREYQRLWTEQKRRSGWVQAHDYPKEYQQARARPGYHAYIAAHTKRRYHENPVHRAKVLARATLHDRVKRGVIKRQPCETCASTPADAHHDDYSKPLDVRWLCKPCHKKHHARIDGRE